ncbi:HPr family phosphocarrier protein [Demequina zhanjiangensis]|uniref:Phosphocarrier protein HPr n=1 Tax=Demequina zhanjiangensis TaxID=3051659 RepID=A0ABT8G0S0_9MICO|nr:HPr family phosphocarrier protein [Demequina sp. SYSU T00b26]MDN4472741.1 HPr family phosphocarrier protein [Demequina sp. SYSU T00b26]
MPQRQTTIANLTGLHARPAALFAKKAAASGHAITIARAGEAPIDASSILMIMGLGLSHGDDVTLVGDDGSDQILDELVEMLESDLDSVPA